MPIFADEALKYWEAGYSPIPVIKRQKRPVLKYWQKYCDERPTREELEQWRKAHADCNIGLALGTSVHDYHVVAIDVDADDLIEPTRAALGEAPAKVGKKGITFFALADASIVNHKIRRVDASGKPDNRPAIEILAKGSQTVLPPSVHPDGPVYSWRQALLEVPTERWPILTRDVIDELVAHCHGKGKHFTDLNTMLWRGVGGGGNTHDTCVAAVACMVARGWVDSSIMVRIQRAKRDSSERAGEAYNWPEATHVIQGWIDSAREKGMEGRVKPKKLPPERVMAEWALHRLGGPENVRTVKGQLRAYRDGHWPEVVVPALLRSMYEFDESLREREAKAAISIIHTLTEDVNFGRTTRHRICLQNGTLNLKTGELEVWAPEHEILHQLNIEWDDEADCPIYHEVVHQTLNGDEEAINLWDEFCALTLVDDISFQMLLFLKGPGGNGKGTLARVLRHMHDPAAVGSVAITDLNDERKRTSLVGKLVNISGEQSRLNLVSDTYLKKITGGDPIDVRKLYGETQNNVVLSVRFLELVNDMPATSDHSYALKRRIVILECPNKVTEPDLDLDRKLMAERPGILRRWARALQRLYARGKFLIPASSDKEVEEYITQNDPVAYWLQERMRPAQGKDINMANRDLYADFREWAMLMGYKPIPPEVTWGKKLTDAGYPTITTRIGQGYVKARRLRFQDGKEMPL